MSRTTYTLSAWHDKEIEYIARARDYKDKDGNYKTDYIAFNPYGSKLESGDLLKVVCDEVSPNITLYFHIEKAENKVDNTSDTLLTGYWVWSVYAGTVKSVDDLPTDAHEGEYYLVKPSEKTPIKDYKYYERIGDEWKPMGTYWG